MPTRQAVEREIRKDLAAQGYSVALLRQWPARATYYKTDGEAMPGLPADPFSMQRYLARGFTLFPPPPKVEDFSENGGEVSGVVAEVASEVVATAELVAPPVPSRKKTKKNKKGG